MVQYRNVRRSADLGVVRGGEVNRRGESGEEKLIQKRGEREGK